MKKYFHLVWFALLALQNAVASKDFPIDLSKSSCQDKILAEAASFGVDGGWRRFIDNFNGSKVFRAPTKTLGAWFEVQVAQDGKLLAFEITPYAVTVISPKLSTCEINKQQKDRKLDAEKMAAAFTDADLIAFAEANPSGAAVIAWSPGMPLSLQMIKNVRKVAKLANIPVVFVLDPHANPRLAAKVASEHDLGDVLEPMESVELMFQGLSTHYPAMILLQDGKIASPVLPGLSGVQQLLNFIGEYTEGELQTTAQTIKYDVSQDIKTGGIDVPALMNPSKTESTHSTWWIVSLIFAILLLTLYLRKKK